MITATVLLLLFFAVRKSSFAPYIFGIAAAVIILLLVRHFMR